MRVKRKILRQIILEAITSTRQGAIAVKGTMASRQYPEAIIVALEDTKKLIKALSVTSKYKTKPQYVWKGSKIGASEKLYAVGELTNGNGDPFTYNKEGNKYRVVSGPEPKTIGKIFTMDPPPALSTDNLEAGDTEVSARQDVLKMSLGDYAENYLSTDQQRIFNNWPIFSRHKNKSVLEWFSNDEEIIKDSFKINQEVAQRIQSGTLQPGALRAPTNLIDAYAKGLEDQDALATVYQTARDVIFTKELKDALREQ